MFWNSDPEDEFVEVGISDIKFLRKFCELFLGG
jgi:hypothetical protein